MGLYLAGLDSTTQRAVIMTLHHQSTHICIKSCQVTKDLLSFTCVKLTCSKSSLTVSFQCCYTI